jgi:hypothetical protein
MQSAKKDVKQNKKLQWQSVFERKREERRTQCDKCKKLEKV